MAGKEKGKLRISLLAITLLPMFCLWMIISIVSVSKVKSILDTEVENNLRTVVYSVISAYDYMVEGDYYFLEEEEELYVMKGEVCLNYNTKYIDDLKEKTGTDISFFNGDTRYLTTLTNEEGERLNGTSVRNIIKKHVIDQGEEYFVNNVYIAEERCFSYYAPIKNSDGKIVGMVGISESASEVDGNAMKVIIPMVVITVILMIIAGIITVIYAEKIVVIINKTKNFLAKVATGDLSCTISYDVLKREDELGEIGKSALDMQKSLKIFVEHDGLTGLLNRRYGQKTFDEMSKKCEDTGEKYCICLCDIDYFKKVNDTYGHEAGDMVLKEVAAVLKNNMVGKGYAARWGGEEFLLMFRGVTLLDATEVLKDISKEIKRMKVETDQGDVSVTMTFGVVEKDETIEAKDIINEADELLYYGKENGRDRIVRREDIGREINKK